MNLVRLSCSVLPLAALLLAGCSTPSEPSSPTVTQPGSEADKLRVGISPSLPPLAFKEGSTFQGLEPALARALAADLGRQAEFVELPWESLMDALLNGKVDILMSGMTITPARLMRVNFARPYLKAGQTLLVRRTDALRIQVDLFDPKTRIGAQKATTGDLWAKQNCAKNHRKLFPTAELGARALIGGQIDAFVCDAPVNWWLASKYEAAGLTVTGGYLTEEYLGWAIRKEDTALLEAANRFIEENHDSGELRELIRNWVPFE